MWARLSGAMGLVAQGCGKLEASPAASRLGQTVMPWGAAMGSWAVGRVGKPQGKGLVRDSHCWCCPRGPGRDVGVRGLAGSPALAERRAGTHR